MKVIDSHKSIKCPFRTWELAEYPFLPTNTRHSWSVRTCNNLEKPRYVIIGFQTDRKNTGSKSMAVFDHCNLTNLKVYLNTQVYPYEDFRADYPNNLYSLFYNSYIKFQRTYYDRDWASPLLNHSKFKDIMPVAVIDMSRQDDDIKINSGLDLRLEFEFSNAVPEKTTAYCLVIHDQIITYNPFSGDVRKL
ncbi:uncharacterized protein LOC126908204 [Daktulosphaira vitifoliae]|uniref:uncharacterized protein LOC126908204 n=1 Tax=Daktulosphaira vitifoliae TaxID=58002 RepID=UPI0021AA2F05|nr:uncharacterized protein LOC126908204 [Daktulosphaira vitifoliae]